MCFEFGGELFGDGGFSCARCSCDQDDFLAHDSSLPNVLFFSVDDAISFESSEKSCSDRLEENFDPLYI